MKIRLYYLPIFIFSHFLSFAQDYGRITIKNADVHSPAFITSLNGIRIQNDYSTSVTYKFADEAMYRVKILQAGSSTILRFNISSELKYNSTFLLSQDNSGRYTLLLQSKTLMLNENEPEPIVTPTVSVNQTTLIAAEPMNLTVMNKQVPMSDIVFKAKYEEVKSKAFDDDKIERIKEAFEYENFTTNQVINLMKLFSFDDKKVEAAKFAYPKTLDHENFYKTYDQLSFSSSKTSLKAWVNEHKND